MTKGSGKTDNSMESEGIPVRKVVLSDSAQIPHHYSETPNGTIFSTTPGGTRIIYDRSFLLNLRNSPLSRSPPKNLKVIPGITKDDDGKIIEEDESGPCLDEADEAEACPSPGVIDMTNGKGGKKDIDDTQFDMDI